MNLRQCTVCLFSALFIASAQAGEGKLQAAIEGDHRTPAYLERDRYRHPKETLEFFGVEPEMTVVEVSPGGGWYTEILAPYLREKGTLYAAHFPEDTTVEYYMNSRKQFMEKIAAHPEVYDRIKITAFNPPEHVDIAPEGSADRVLTFRNVHSWYMRGGGEERLLSAFNAFNRALKPGGVLGVVEHRLPESRPLSDQEQSGYMRQDYVIDIAEKAGFELADKSAVNANPKDTADHPKGVWTLPPGLRLGEEKRDHYKAIGESDRMTLKFIKPEAGGQAF